MSDAGPIVPPPPPPPPPSAAPTGAAPRPGRGWLWGSVGLLFVGFLAGALFVPLPYYLLRPGIVRETEGLIAVDGTDVYPADGSISFTTVRMPQASLVGVAWGWLHPDVDVLTRSEAFGDLKPSQNRRVNLQLMDTSKLVATQVALEHLGYDVDVSINGMTVVEVQPGSGADGVLEPGDVLVAVRGERLDQPDELSRVMAGAGPGTSVPVQVERVDGTTADLQVVLGSAPDNPSRGVMGVLIQARGIEFHFPFDVEIDSGKVGGPSAGLAFTLGLLDVLTPGELTGGRRVAVTGTIDSSGVVGPVGGTAQKAAAAKGAGAAVFLVPRADLAEASAHAGDMRVVPVDDLDDALAALADLGGNALALGRPGEATGAAA